MKWNLRDCGVDFCCFVAFGFDSRVSISLPIRVVIVNCGLLCELVALLN